MSRHWSINGRFLAQSLTGVQRYAREIVQALDVAMGCRHPLTSELSVELLVPPDATDDLRLKAIRTRRVGTATGHAWEQLSLPRHARGGLISLGNAGPVVKGRQIVCLHDTTARDYPASYSRLFRLSQLILQPCLGRISAGVMTVSAYSAAQLGRHGICRPEKIAIAANGHEHALAWHPSHTPVTRSAAGPGTIVVIGTDAPHKNVGLLLGMAERLASFGLSLAIVGSLDERVFQANGVTVEAPNVMRLGRLTDEAMAALLQDSLCLAFPSLSEGFGLPVLEAMALGCPVVVSNRASLPEICGDAALYACPERPQQWLAAFLRLRNDAELRERQRSRGREQALGFSWQRSAGHYLEAMARADGWVPDNIGAVVATADRYVPTFLPSASQGLQP